jgi:hypothetical protein
MGYVRGGLLPDTHLGAGMLAVVQPQFWLASSALLGLGGAVGGILTYKRLVLQVPISVTRVAALGTGDFWHTSKEAVVVSPAILVGVSF